MRVRQSDILTGLVLMMVLPTGSTSCSDRDEPALPPGTEGSVIAFTDPDTREAVTTLTIQKFKVWAFTDPYNQTVMSGIKVERTGLNSWTYSPVTAWPDRKVDFYAVSPVTVSADINLPYSHYVDFAAGDGRTDLLVAVKMGAQHTDGRIRLNFCHTLARVTAIISTNLSDTIVRIKRIAVTGVGSNGRYNIPLQNTVKDEPADEVTSAWQIWNMEATRFNLYLNETADTTLTAEPYHPEGGAEFFLPVAFNRMSTEGGYLRGSTIEVAYQLINRKTGKKIWPKGTTDRHLLAKDLPGWGAANFPLLDNTPDGRWYAGREYHYDISIKGAASLPAGSRSYGTGSNSMTATVRNY